MIIVTGSEGLIGRQVVKDLRSLGFFVRGYDIQLAEHFDTRDHDLIFNSFKDIQGIIHLAAISRVAWAERYPSLSEEINATALRNILEKSLAKKRRPWVIFGSSREVYGQAINLPVTEEAPLRPVNVYGRTKLKAESVTADAAANGMIAQIVRFSNVYGSPSDHPDRVATAFSRAAAFGGRIRIDGKNCLFDFTHVADVSKGIVELAKATMAGEQFPPVHLVSGAPTSLADLAEIALRYKKTGNIEVEEAPVRQFDVARFYGNPSLARKLMGWSTTIRLEDGISNLVDQLILDKHECQQNNWFASLVRSNKRRRDKNSYCNDR